MNTLVIVLIAAVVLVCAYAGYGRWLAKTWGIDPKAQTPAVKHNDGKDFVPTNGWTVFSHQFSSIAGAGPVTGAIQAAAFGWLPVLLWVLLGGIFMLTDYSTSPATEWGKVVFALGAGIITMLIRNSSGGYPEGVSFAILLMNIICPHLNKIGAKKPFGVGGAEK